LNFFELFRGHVAAIAHARRLNLNNDFKSMCTREGANGSKVENVIGMGKSDRGELLTYKV
jgi:hypothetical protein